MNHSLKNPDAHRRLARGANALSPFRGLSNRHYMAGAEFEARQMWLDFEDAVGTALQAIASSVQKSRQQFKKWLREFVRPVEVRFNGWKQLDFGWKGSLA